MGKIRISNPGKISLLSVVQKKHFKWFGKEINEKEKPEKLLFATKYGNDLLFKSNFTIPEDNINILNKIYTNTGVWK